MIKKIKQHDYRDCGPACLASIAHHYHLKIPIARIRQLATTDKKGTNALGMIKAAEKMGFKAKGVKGDVSALPNAPLPAVAHVIIDGKLEHYMVLYRVRRQKVMVMDPGPGEYKSFSLDEFDRIWSGVLILLQPGNQFESGNQSKPLLNRFWDLVRPHRFTVFQALFGAILYTVLGLSTSIYIQKITDHVLVNRNENLLALLSIAMVIILVLQIFVGSLKSLMILRTGQMIDSNLILGYYKHLLSLPQRFFDTMRTGEIISRINDAVKIRAFINDVAINLVVSVCIIVFSFLLMFTYYWKLALIIFIIIPLYLILYLIVNYLNKKVERRVMEQSADLESQLVESINSVQTIKQFGVEGYANAKTENKFIRLLYTIYRSGQNSIFTGNTTEFLSRTFTIVLLWLGSIYVIEGIITPGELLSFYALIGYFMGPLQQLVGMNKTIQNAVIAADRLFEIMDLEREETVAKVDIVPQDVGDISFEGVSFSYGTRIEVFNKLDIVFPRSKVSAIVGESGSGKTTLVSLIQNLYPVELGRIKIGNYELREINNQSLRALIGVVPQKLTLFSGNVLDNIALGIPGPDMKKIIQLVKKLGLEDFIRNLPQGYQTHLGEDGSLLSGGQRQRLAIARALYRDPEIIIFDEATSSMDSISEGYVEDILRELKAKGKTILIIAHRLSTVTFADQIYVLKAGRLMEQGSHEELLHMEKEYAMLWAKQSLVM